MSNVHDQLLNLYNKSAKVQNYGRNGFNLTNDAYDISEDGVSLKKPPVRRSATSNPVPIRPPVYIGLDRDDENTDIGLDRYLKPLNDINKPSKKAKLIMGKNKSYKFPESLRNKKVKIPSAGMDAGFPLGPMEVSDAMLRQAESFTGKKTVKSREVKDAIQNQIDEFISSKTIEPTNVDAPLFEEIVGDVRREYEELRNNVKNQFEDILGNIEKQFQHDPQQLDLLSNEVLANAQAALQQIDLNETNELNNIDTNMNSIDDLQDLIDIMQTSGTLNDNKYEDDLDIDENTTIEPGRRINLNDMRNYNEGLLNEASNNMKNHTGSFSEGPESLIEQLQDLIDSGMVPDNQMDRVLAEIERLKYSRGNNSGEYENSDALDYIDYSDSEYDSDTKSDNDDTDGYNSEVDEYDTNIVEDEGMFLSKGEQKLKNKFKKLKVMEIASEIYNDPVLNPNKDIKFSALKRLKKDDLIKLYITLLRRS